MSLDLNSPTKRLNLDRATNFMRQFRDPDSRELKKLSANQFMEVWSHYDKDGNGYIEGTELDGFLREFVSSANFTDVSPETTRSCTTVVCEPPPKPDISTLPCCPPTRISKLANGVRIGSEATDANLTCISLLIEAGPRFEQPCYNGVTHFIEHLAYEGFCSMPKDVLENSINNSGNKLWAKTYPDKIVFTGLCFPDYTDRMIEIFYKIITDLAVSDDKIAEVRDKMKYELLDADEDPKTVVFEYLISSAYQGTPMGQRVIGPTGIAKLFTTSLIKEYMCSQFLPQNIVIAAAGNIDHDHLENKVIETFGNLKNCGSPCEFMPARYTGSTIIYRDDTMPFAHVAYGVEAFGCNDKNYFPFKILTHAIPAWCKSQGGEICGGRANTMAMGLPRVASGGHLCEFYKPFYITFKDTGLYGIYFVASKLMLEDMCHNIMYTWKELCTMYLETDFEVAVTNFQFQTERSLINLPNLTYDIGSQIMYTNTRRTVNELIHELRKFQPADCAELLNEVFYDTCPVVTATGPTENLPEYTRLRAGMYFIRF